MKLGFVVEGETEEAFVKHVLRPHLFGERHVSLHELEALIFADLDQVAAVHPEWRTEIEELAIQVLGLPPEAIDDRRETSPSHRLLRATANRYNKVVDGPSILRRIGLPALRAACPHFASWLGTLEGLVTDR